jgi:hypothetical protein
LRASRFSFRDIGIDATDSTIATVPMSSPPVVLLIVNPG